MMQPLLIELGTEELPVKALPGLAQALFDGVIDGLVKRGIALDRFDAKPLYTPRRLTVLLPGVAAEQPQQRSEVLGPYLDSALDADGAPTRALQGFAQKNGVDWTQLEKMTDGKGERFVHRAIRPGARVAELLPEIVREAIAAMPIPKPMRWGDHDHAFARPVHWLVLLFGDEVVEGEALGIKAGRNSRGHRFMHPKPVWIGTPGDYVDALRAAQVLVDPDERRARIVREVEQAATDVGGLARIDPDNLEQVNCLSEWPSAVLCDFDPEFLAVPQEALVATMETNQKFFPVIDSAGKLTEHFIGIANLESTDVAAVRQGYERVIRPRFADAQFFFVEDMKQGLASMNEGLQTVTYQAKLGTVADKVARVAALAETIADEVGVDPRLARRAAELSKADLQSRLVNEFPELQGIAGRYYAAVTGEPLEVANAIDEAYMPRFAGDAIAPSKLGQVLAIVERLDTLAVCFNQGMKPSGNKDPFALRRAALGLARTLIEGGLDLDLLKLIDLAVTSQPVKPAAASNSETSRIDLFEFILDRLRGYFDERGIPALQFEATASRIRSFANVSLLDFDHRLKAIGEFAMLPEAEALAAANKRIRNILRKAEGAIAADVDPALFAEPAEGALFDAVLQAIADTDEALKQRDYVAVLGRLARLRPLVDAFFDKVMVNVDDSA
ncbi:MAG: glycine--tRNA ligase subunit beta, partial [Gammaproteobacteria bacterium]|nr:glycine--tRNA ligase subunit beta [Gammaproteobacteria bacterium]